MQDDNITNILNNALNIYNQKIDNILLGDTYGMSQFQACDNAKDECAEYIFKQLSNHGAVYYLNISRDNINANINGKLYKAV